MNNPNTLPIHFAEKTTSVQTPTTLITGATGTIGQELTNALLDRGLPFRVMVRSGNESRFASQNGVEVKQGDFNDPVSLRNALQSIERAFLLTNSSEQAEAQQLRFVAEARRAGVRHIVKLSQFAADEQSPVRFLRYHAVVERAIRESGIAFTFLRPNLFMQGLLGFRSTIAGQGKFFASIDEAPVSLIDVRDIAEVAATTLTEPGHEGKVYDLTGPQALTHAALADELSVALGRRIVFVSIPPEAMRQALLGVGFPQWQADGLIEDYAHYNRHEASAVTSDVRNVTGKAARPFAAFVNDYAALFS